MGPGSTGDEIGASASRPGAEIPPNVYATMKKTYDYSGLSALRF
jgi:hypothetical protein